MHRRWSSLSDDERAAYGNGVGPHWFPEPVRNFITDVCSFFFREAAWNHHDYGYVIGGNEIDRINCDARFLGAMRRDVYRCYWPYKPIAWLLCHFFYAAVRLGGWASFNYH